MDTNTKPTMEALADFDDALSRAFAKVARARPDGVDKNIKKDGRDRRYVTLASVDEACREALTSEGFSFPQLVNTEPREGGGLWLTVTTQIRRKGIKLESTLGLPVLGQMIAAKDGGGFREPTAQSVGSAQTYGRRYALSALMGVCPDEDDDGHAASRHPEPEPDRLWMAFEAKRNALCQVMRTDAKAVTRLVREAAGITHDREPSDPEVERMIAAADRLLAPPQDDPPADDAPKAKARAKAAAKPQDRATPEPSEDTKRTNAARAIAGKAWKRYQDTCNAEGVPAMTYEQIGAEAIGKPWSTESGAHGEADYVLLADALHQATERLLQQGVA